MSWLWGKFRAAIAEVVGWVVDAIVALLGTLGDWLLALLPDGVQTFVNGLDFSAIDQHLDVLNYLFPIYAIFGIVSLTYAFVGLIWLGRHLAGLIPFVNLG